jgi:hypothetical protein
MTKSVKRTSNKHKHFDEFKKEPSSSRSVYRNDGRVNKFNLQIYINTIVLQGLNLGFS